MCAAISFSRRTVLHGACYEAGDVANKTLREYGENMNRKRLGECGTV
jgi:hypothetical protein